MALRTEIAADHEDWREPASRARYLNGVERARVDIAEAVARRGGLPIGHPAQRRIAERIREATDRLEWNTAQLRALEDIRHAA
ncbi:hypothetical protein [Roseococcus pinisoli]|uniref:Uncharacterized protein n=1 Tax=Roseococcus pinisoli TaxID=2835040 RepID=A0ABS5QBX8_9PROT|nr:hypothetical protein [Roseococcus pinisoli]MBS7811180.1 hypothetical protein [Roseococcus pinisoli]